MEALRSIEDLDNFRKAVKKIFETKKCDDTKVKIIVSEGSSEIASGVEEILNIIRTELSKNNLIDVPVEKRCCLGMDSEMPIVVIQSNCEYFCYGKVTPELIIDIIRKHILGGRPILERIIARGEICEEA